MGNADITVWEEEKNLVRMIGGKNTERGEKETKRMSSETKESFKSESH